MGLMHDVTGTCKQVTELISQGMDRDLSWAERLRIRLHLMLCKGCTHYEDQMAVLRNVSRAFADHFSPRDKG
jgi:putative zinc finger protein